MKTLPCTLVWLIVVSLFCRLDARAQMSRNNNKSSNVYRKSYQRMVVGMHSNSTFEIRGGTLWAWGENGGGELGLGYASSTVTTPQQVGRDINWVSVAAMVHGTIALKSDGTLWTWGGWNSSQFVPTQVGRDNDWVSIGSGSGHYMAIKSNGTLWTWGSNAFGELGYSGLGTSVPTQVTQGGNDWVGVAGGHHFSLALKSDGTLWAWGLNSYGQLGNGTYDSITSIKHPVPTRVGADNDWVSIAAGHAHCLALKSNGTLWGWGANVGGQLGLGYFPPAGSWGDVPIPTRVGADNNWTSVTAGSSHTIALKSNGTLWAWGNNFYGQMGDGTQIDSNTPTRINADKDWVSIVAGYAHTAALKSDGTLWTWGRNREGQLGDGTTIDKSTQLQINQSNLDWLQVAVGGNHTAALKSDGTLWAWGANDVGQLGLGNGSPGGPGANELNPVQIFMQSGRDNDWVSVVAGLGHTIALKSDGTLWAWGYNYWGQLGLGINGSGTDVNVPTQVGVAQDWVSITAGMHHTLALKSDGTLWAWGENQGGELGLGNSGLGTERNAPTQIHMQAGQDDNWVSIMCGGYHTIALKSNGTLWAWGENGAGQLGLGYNGSLISKPVQEMRKDNDWISIAGGAKAHTIALKSNGTIWGWGLNINGALGLGSVTPYSQPTPTQERSRGNRWISITTGMSHTAGLKSDGNLWAWGSNQAGELGDGSNTLKSIPTQINNQRDVVVLAKGSTGRHSGIIKSNRANICMTGSNSYGQLGDGTTNSTNTYDCNSINLNRGPLQKLAGSLGSDKESQSDFIRASQEVRLYPSPAKDYIIVENGIGTISGVLTDLQGKILMQVSAKSGERINISALSAGLYLLRLSDGNTFKVIVSNQ